LPITPLHFGPAILVKAALPRRFSLFIFALAQVLIDIEPVYLALRGRPPLHRTMHTLAGAALATVLLLAVGGRLYRWLSRRWGPSLEVGGRRIPLMRERLPRGAVLLSALVGTLSQLLLDGLIYSDMRPLWPLSDAGFTVTWLNQGAMGRVCIAAGAVGGAGLLARWWFGRRAGSRIRP
jgi:membrane-bound metal-dependent hydrolase YbcI (DUF457 family)